MGKNSLTKLTERIVRDMDDLALKLQKYLVENGVTPSDSKITSLVESFEKLNVIKPDTEYIHFTISKEGYISGEEEFGAIVEKQELPADIFRGYYKVEDEKIVLDEEQRHKLWEVS